MKMKLDKIQRIHMRDFITPDRFRTVEREQYDYAHGVHEIPVVIDLDKKTEKRLSFSVGERGQIFGFATAFGELLRRFDEVERISMEPTEEDYLFMVVIRGKNDEYYLVSETELVVLLEGALRIPSQR
jgi:hypothetical protein